MTRRKRIDRGRGELVEKKLIITIHITTVILAFLEQFLFVKNMGSRCSRKKRNRSRKVCQVT